MLKLLLCVCATSAAALQLSRSGAPQPAPLNTRSSPFTAKPNVGATALALGATALFTAEPALAGDVSWIAPTKAALGPFSTIYTLFFLMRVVLSWFPKYDLNQPPWNVAAWPTEPVLKVTRAVVPPVAGVDVSPLVWVGILSFVSEVTLGPQGILTIMQKKG